MSTNPSSDRIANSDGYLPEASAPGTPTFSPHPVAVITGAGGGLGRSFAQALAHTGWRIAALGRTQSTLQETIDCLPHPASHTSATPQGHTAVDSSLTAVPPDSPALTTQQPHLTVTCDITDSTAVAHAFACVTEHFGRLDLLVNNAGIPGPTGELSTINPAEFHRTVETNLTGTFLCTQAAFAWMKTHGGGRIINNGSIAAHAPRPGAAAYAASKAAIASLTHSTALDGRPYNITCTQVDIGNARTALLGSFTTSEPMFPAHHAASLLAAVAALPTSVTVDQLTITATGMPYRGRG